MAKVTKNEKLVVLLAELDHLTNWEQRSREGMEVGLEPIADIASRLGNPHQGFRVVHVTGMKGKSSTSALIEAGLCHAEVLVGRYSSPHVSHVTERITLNGRPVSEDKLATAIEAALAAHKSARAASTSGAYATWFDLLTAAAFVVFRDAGVQWAVVECGLGGRSDSTNIVEGEIAVLTNVELEHTEVLGKTRSAIAFEKAGIIKSGCAVVTTLPDNDEAGLIVRSKATALGCSVVRPKISESSTIDERNIAVAGAVLDIIGDRGVAGSGRSGGKSVGRWLLDRLTVDQARLPGRMEIVRSTSHQGSVDVVLDGAHVPFNLALVMTDLVKLEKFRGPCVAVIAIAQDKDAAGLLQVLASMDVSIIFTAAGPRSRDPEELEAIASGVGLDSTVTREPSVAYALALERAAASAGWVLVTGSLSLVGLVRHDAYCIR